MRKKKTATKKTARKKVTKKAAGKVARKKAPARKKRTAKKAAAKKKTTRKPRPISEMTCDSWTLRLYIAGDTPKSVAARENLKRLCDKHLPARCKVEVVDLMEHPELARADQVLAIPTLVRRLPQPVRRIIGDLSHEERALLALDLRQV